MDLQLLESYGQIANQLAGRAAWSDYRERLAPNTRNRQDNDRRSSLLT